MAVSGALEESQNDRNRLNLKVERLEERVDQLDERLAEDHDTLVVLKTRAEERDATRDKGDAKMWAVYLVLIGAVVQAIAAVVFAIKK